MNSQGSNIDISVFIKNPNIWTAQELKKVAKKIGVGLEIVNVKSLNKPENFIDNLGEIILWRASYLKAPLERSIFLEMCKDRFIINEAIYKTPHISHKLYQQKKIAQINHLKGIKTFHYRKLENLKKAIEKKELIYPFIMKKDVGAQGENVFLIKQFQDLKKYSKNLDRFIFQNFIENNGDYRVLVFGGKVLGMMKRKRTKESEFRNNISQGGKAYAVKDEEIRNELTKIGVKTASFFDLQLCGVDIIFDEKEEKFKIMEINTVPQWRGLQAINKTNIAEDIISHCKSLLQRGKIKTPILVKQYYEKNYNYLGSKKLHYSSRKWLWFKESIDRRRLYNLREKYFDEEKLNELFKNYMENGEELNKSRFPTRQVYLQKYPHLKAYSRILFIYLLGKVVYEKDIKNLVSKYLSEKQIFDLQQKLLNDPDALRGLSTSAVNFLYFSENYLKKRKAKINPKYLLKVIKDYDPENEKQQRLKIYFITHCVIGATNFYSKPLKKHRPVYLKMVKELENIIAKKYFQVTLDNKLEFLVISKICKYKSYLQEIIKNEAENSLSKMGNYIIDQLPETKKKFGNNLLSSEHRNILYLMAMFPRSNPLS